jgi:hypothetical protein
LKYIIPVKGESTQNASETVISYPRGHQLGPTVKKGKGFNVKYNDKLEEE